MECESEVNKAKCTCTYEPCNRKKLLGIIMLDHHSWADRVKRDPRVEVVMVSRANHQQVAKELLAWLKS